MNDYNEKKEKKGGFWSALSGLFRGGSGAGGASGFGGAGAGAGGIGGAARGLSGLAGLFSTKAGMVGMVLGGATIAAGVGVIYNFIGPSSNSAYSPDLFQNSYYEEEASKAGRERAMAREGASASTLDMFREQAKKDGIGLEGDASTGQAPDPNAEVPGASADAAAPEAPAGVPGDNMPRLQSAAGFGSKGGGGGGNSFIPRMQGGGGMSGGIGSQFSSVYRPPAKALGKTSGMSAAAARVKGSPKYAVPNFNKKGAFGQAKFAKNMGNQARYGSDVGAKGQAGVPFDTAQQAGTGDVGTPATGSGLGGAGVSNGANLRGNDPSLNNNEVTPPKVPDPVDVSPWKAWTDRAMYAMLAATVLILLTKVLANFAKGVPWMYMAAMVTAYAAMAAAALVIVSGMMLMSKYGQKWQGAMYLVAGAMLMWQAYQALAGVGEAATKAGANLGSMGKACPGYNASTAFGNSMSAPGASMETMGNSGWTTGSGAEATITPPEGVNTIAGSNGATGYAVPNATAGGGTIYSGGPGSTATTVTPQGNVLAPGGQPSGLNYNFGNNTMTNP
ncbi:MAG: hypothetical protein NDI60_00480 [Elusimicrobiales bacterium]|nr:hypothetical protein [Elusimicrobiales bacterium]